VALATPAALAGDPLTSPSARTQLRALTQVTGGVLFNVARVEVGQVVPTLLELSKPDTAVILARSLVLAAGTPVLLEVPVDDTLSEVTFMVTASTAAGLPALTLRRPDGTVVADGDPGITRRRLSSVDSIAVAAPVVGRWRLQFDGTGAFTLRVFGPTPFRLNSVRLQARVATPSRPEMDFEPLSGQPVVGANLVADLRLTAAPSTLTATTRRPDGTVLQDLTPLESIDGARRFRAGLTVPGETFIVEATGLTAGGAEFVRDVTVPAQPQTVAVEATPAASTARPGTDATINVRVRNVGGAEATYRLQTLSSLGWTVSGPASVTVAAGGFGDVVFLVRVPDGAAEGLVNGVTILAEDNVEPRVRNSASVSVIAGPLNQPPVCGGATADPSVLFPPNHRMRPIAIQGVTDPDGDPVTLTVDRITQDEPVCGHTGEGQPDGAGVGTATPSVRAERRGHGDGRVYEITFTASDGRGESCSAAIQVGVPKHPGRPALDSGQSFDSTVVSPEAGCEDDDDDGDGDDDHDGGDHRGDRRATRK
jgi:hypothetical protein